MKEDRQIKGRDVATTLRLSYGATQKILTQDLGLSKICARWVPCLLTSAQKQDRAEKSIALYQRFQTDPTNFKQRLVTGDGTWVYSYDPETKQQSKQWI